MRSQSFALVVILLSAFSVAAEPGSRASAFRHDACETLMKARFTDDCCAGGTMIDTPRGQVAIEYVRPGDKVFAYDFATNRIVIDEITVSVDASERKVLITTRFDNGAWISTTEEHPVYSLDQKTFVKATDLRLGEAVLQVEKGRILSVTVTAREVLPSLHRVYNFRTKTHHNYLANGILVHNINANGL